MSVDDWMRVVGYFGSRESLEEAMESCKRANPDKKYLVRVQLIEIDPKKMSEWLTDTSPSGGDRIK